MNIRIKCNPVFRQTGLSTPRPEEGDALDGHRTSNFELISKITAVTTSTHKIQNDSFDKIVIVGDSLSDSEGRMKSKSLGLIPSAPQYYDGRFTNGYTWVDFLSSPAYMNVEVENKAEGGAVAGNYCKLNPVFIFISSMSKQIKGVRFNERDLAIVSIGSNDYISFKKENVSKVIGDQVKNINKMIKHGAKNIIVMGVPDFSQTPNAQAKDKAYQSSLQALSKHHNEMLEAEIIKIRDESGINIKYFDLNTCLNFIIQHAKELGYDHKHAFHHGYIGGGALDIMPNYVFNDSVHPTQEVHAIFAMKIQEFIANEFYA